MLQVLLLDLQVCRMPAFDAKEGGMMERGWHVMADGRSLIDRFVDMHEGTEWARDTDGQYKQMEKHFPTPSSPNGYAKGIWRVDMVCGTRLGLYATYADALRFMNTLIRDGDGGGFWTKATNRRWELEIYPKNSQRRVHYYLTFYEGEDLDTVPENKRGRAF